MINSFMACIPLEGDALRGGARGLVILDESRNWPLCGGNKMRKLFSIMENHRPSGILTFGSKYSSHCLAAAYWGAMRACPVRLLVLDDEEPNYEQYPHLALSARLGAEMVFVPTCEARERIDHERTGRPGYHWIPGGGHCRKGLEAYRDWFSRVLMRYPELGQRHAVVLPYGTGTTALGILSAIRDKGMAMRVIGVSVSRDRQQCYRAAREWMNEDALAWLDIDDRFAGHYGQRVPSHEKLRMDFLKRTGIFPDPIYNIRVVEFLESEKPDNIIMIHTGGQINNLLP